MNIYNLSQVLFMAQCKGAVHVYTERTDHGGATSAFLYFHKPRPARELAA